MKIDLFEDDDEFEEFEIEEGHAFEARIYAENVARGFLPATGTLHHYQPVSISPTVRVETGVQEGDTVNMHYDPMIAKNVVWGENRKDALVNLKNCLQNFQVTQPLTSLVQSGRKYFVISSCALFLEI